MRPPGRIVNEPGIVHITSAQPMSASGSPSVAISQSKTALTSSPTNAKLPGFGSPCTSVIGRALLGPLGEHLGQQPLERRERAPLHAAHLAAPVVELAVEEVAGRRRGSRGPPARGRRSGSPRSARPCLATSAGPAPARRAAPRGRPLVDGAVEPLHHVELAAEHVARALVPVAPSATAPAWVRAPAGSGTAARGRTARAGPGSGGRMRITTSRGAARRRRPREREQQRLGGVAELDAVEAPRRARRARREVAKRTRRQRRALSSVMRSSRRGPIRR